MKSGDRFTRLVLVERTEGSDRQYWRCACDCGNDFKARADKLKDGRQKSCGCLKKETADRLYAQRISEIEERQRVLREQKQVRLIEEARESIQKKHEKLLIQIEAEGVPKSDLLWNPLFYAELVKDGCIFCGQAPEFWLDKVYYLAELSAGNSVPICSLCRTRRHDYRDELSFEEMALVGQTIQFIRLARYKNGFPEIVTQAELDETILPEWQ